MYPEMEDLTLRDIPSNHPLRQVLRNCKRRAICMMVLEGKTADAMGKTLQVSGQTVKNYLKEIYDATGMSSRLELAMWLVNHGVRPVFDYSVTFPRQLDSGWVNRYTSQ